MLLLFLSGVENLSRSEEAFTKNGSVGSGFISYKPGNGHREEKFTSIFVPCVEAPFLI